MKAQNLTSIWPKSIFDCKSNRDIYGQEHAPMVCWKNPLPIQTEWDRVKQMRKNKCLLIKGGNFNG